MRICVRVDDIGFRPHYELDDGLEMAQEFHAAMRGHPYLAGAIPGILDNGGAAWMRSRPVGMTAAMHGWRHCPGAMGGACEFEGMSRDECAGLLRQALGVLGPVRDFIPPRNAVTDELLDACALEGLSRVWGQPYAAEDPYPPEPSRCGRFVPSWLPLYGATRWRMADDRIPVLDALDTLNERDGTFPVVLHITWEASLSHWSFDGVGELIRRFGDRMISPDEYMRLRAA